MIELTIGECDLWVIREPLEKNEGRGGFKLVYATDEVAAASYASTAGVMGTSVPYNKVPEAFVVKQFRDEKWVTLGYVPELLLETELVTMTPGREAEIIEKAKGKLTPLERRLLGIK